LSFLAGWRLVLLLVVIALAIAYVILQATRRKYVVRFTNVDLLASVAPKRPGWRRHVAAACMLLALALTVIAFAQPTMPTDVPRERATVVLAFDVSQSMAATDVKPTRVEAAQKAANRFADILPPKFKLGFVAFAQFANLLLPPTTNRAAFKNAVQGVGLEQRTAIGEAIFTSLDAIKALRREARATSSGRKAPVPAVIVVMSDGFTNSGRPNDRAARAAVKAKVPVSTISFGTPNGSVVVNDRPVAVPADPDALREIADTTGGSFSQATSEAELKHAYEGLNSSIGFKTVDREVTIWFVGIALLFAFAAAGASLFWTSRLP
jgi:Ca-activated chloride channel family protein